MGNHMGGMIAKRSAGNSEPVGGHVGTGTDTGELLELKREAGGLRYYLAGKPVHAGELLEVLLHDGSWALGRYEWNYLPDSFPWFIVETESGDAIDLNPERSRLRWPQHL